jgi:hypothetical protein
MARSVTLRHPKTNVIKKGLFGFSWTTLFFSFFVPLFRGDLVTSILLFIVEIIVILVTSGFGFFVAPLIWAFFYNKTYTTKLLEAGYEFYDQPSRVHAAKRKLKIASTPSVPLKGPPSSRDDEAERTAQVTQPSPPAYHVLQRNTERPPSTLGQRALNVIAAAFDQRP